MKDDASRQMPQFEQLMEPTVRALEKLGGSGSIGEIAAEVIQELQLPESITSKILNPAKSSQTQLENRLGWARLYLKKYGLITNSARGVWAFTEQYQPGQKIDSLKIYKFVEGAMREAAKNKSACASKNKVLVSSEEEYFAEVEEESENNWKDALHQAIMNLAPDAFERLTKRLLRENGFMQVEVTGKTGDGGIDGKGILRLQNIISYHVVFQCKRHQGSVGAGAIRDFRGAMMGRADKGIFITTGTFTQSAKAEAIRDGATTIDLIDGELLTEMLKRLGLGVKVSMVEKIEIDTDWFCSI